MKSYQPIYVSLYNTNFHLKVFLESTGEERTNEKIVFFLIIYFLNTHGNYRFTPAVVNYRSN